MGCHGTTRKGKGDRDGGHDIIVEGDWCVQNREVDRPMESMIKSDVG